MGEVAHEEIAAAGVATGSVKQRIATLSPPPQRPAPTPQRSIEPVPISLSSSSVVAIATLPPSSAAATPTATPAVDPVRSVKLAKG